MKVKIRVLRAPATNSASYFQGCLELPLPGIFRRDTLQVYRLIYTG